MVIADTGYFLALGNQKDVYHRLALKVSKSVQDDLITTWPVITETCYLLASQLGITAELRFLDKAHQQLFDIWAMLPADLARVQILIRQYADLPMDLADASLVLLAERLGHGNILSTDQRDFQTYRWNDKQPFNNLLRPDYSKFTG